MLIEYPNSMYVDSIKFVGNMYRIDRTMPNDGLCRLFLGGSPAYIDDSGFVLIGDSVTYYTKKQLMTFFNECKDDKFTCLEILIEEA